MKDYLSRFRNLVKPKKLRLSYKVKAYTPKNGELVLSMSSTVFDREKAQEEAAYYRKHGKEATIEEIKIIDDGDIARRYPYQGF